jgi:hypothetical protein
VERGLQVCLDLDVIGGEDSVARACGLAMDRPPPLARSARRVLRLCARTLVGFDVGQSRPMCVTSVARSLAAKRARRDDRSTLLTTDGRCDGVEEGLAWPIALVVIGVLIVVRAATSGGRRLRD